MTLKQYRFADVSFFVFLALGSSFLSEFLYREIEHTLVYVNFGLLIALIAMVRWGSIGALAYIVSGIPLLIFRSGDSTLWFQILFYILANGSIALSFILFRFIKRERIHQSVSRSLIYIGFVVIIISIIKGSVFVLIDANPLLMIVQYFAAELFNVVITTVAFIAINQFSEGLITDMKLYILNVQGEKQHAPNP